jgi:adenine-specific DNA methylase
MSKRRLIEDWLPIAVIGLESIRERTPMTPFPAPNRMHVWFARRPLVASRAAILGSLLPAEADRPSFVHELGIHGDPVASRLRIDKAKQTGERFEGDAYTYSRAFKHLPVPSQGSATVLDPTAGGGSVPFEAVRLGCRTFANDLNPVAGLILKATVELPLRFGSALLARFETLSSEFVKRRDEALNSVIPDEPIENCTATNWLWARTITCPYCGGIVPLSTNWKISSSGHGMRLVPQDGHIRFEIVEREGDQSAGTVKGGDGTCPFPDCRRTIDGDEIKAQAQAKRMGNQLYCVVYKEQRTKGYTKAGKPKIERVRGFRAPRPADDVEALVQNKLNEKMRLWRARNIAPDEERYLGASDRCGAFGVLTFANMFSPRQFYSHCTSVEVFQDLVLELERENGDKLSDLDRAALTYVALAIDRLIDYSSLSCLWHANREVMAHTFHRHDFFFKYATAEIAPTATGIGHDWAFEQTGKALGELIDLLGQSSDGRLEFVEPRPKPALRITCTSADSLPFEDASVDCVIMDPPYYDNVMYAELSDFFYVWLKRTAGLLYPSLFTAHLTDKDREAVANAEKFAGQKGGAKELAGRDYQRRMASIFKEQRRVLKPDGIMTVMFTHKASGAWDALAGGLIDAGFTITASWPINTEAEGSLHIREKSAARSTIFLVCRVREADSANAEPRYWEEVEPTVRQAVRAKVKEFQEAGIGGIDLYLACFGPALQVFTEAWPLTRGTARPQPKTKQRGLFEEFDPYAVRPEDALEAARREVKQWRMEQLATVKRQHHLDALTEWYVLAWDAFRAPRFPADEALKLARVVGLDFDQDVKKKVCEVKADDVVLWDSITRHRNGSLGHVSAECMLDTLHWAAKTAREQNTGAAQSLIENAHLMGDPTLLTALEALLNVLPPGIASAGKKKPDANLAGAANDFEALERLRKLAFAETVPAPKIPEQIPLELPDVVEDNEEM